MANAIPIALMFLGLAVMLFGIGVDFLLPGTSPGLNLPQLMIIGAGLAVSFGAYLLGQVDARRRLLAGSRKSLISFILILFVTLFILELLLAVSGRSVYYENAVRKFYRTTAHMIHCSESGCRHNYDMVVAACARGERTGRDCIVNRQGFADDKDFVAHEDFADRTRVLMLGDSYTHGFSADVGMSFVEFVEARFPSIVLWNAGFASTATNQALASYEMLAPILKPHLTVLGFFMNDFDENRLPIDSWFIAEDPEGNTAFIRPYRADQWGNVTRLDDESIRHYISHGVYPPPNEIERLLGNLQLGTLVLRLRDQIARLNVDERLFAKNVEATREILEELHERMLAESSALLILLIPTQTDLTAESERYQTAKDLMHELGLPYMYLTDMLEDEDYMPPPDGHWNNMGHQKVGARLADCTQRFKDSGNLGDCKHVVMPNNDSRDIE